MEGASYRWIEPYARTKSAGMIATRMVVNDRTMSDGAPLFAAALVGLPVAAELVVELEPDVEPEVDVVEEPELPLHVEQLE